MDGYTFASILFFATCVRTDCVIAAYSELLQNFVKSVFKLGGLYCNYSHLPHLSPSLLSPTFTNLHQLSWMMDQETWSVGTSANDILKSNVMRVCAHVVPFKVLSILQ